MGSVELRSKTELTSIAGTENVYIQEAGSPYTVKRTLLNTIRSWIMTAPSSTVYKQATYAILDNDGFTRIEVDTTAGAVTITLPLMANNIGRRIEIAFVKNDASLDVVTISPHATDANKLSTSGLASMTLLRPGQSLTFQQSSNSGFWEVVNENPATYTSAPAYACRAWVNFNGTGTVAIRGSGNVSSVTDNGLGEYTVNFTVDMPDINYCISGSGGHSNETMSVIATIYSSSVGSIHFKTAPSNGSSSDPEFCSILIIR